MPQSLSKVIVHIIFSTKNREPWLDFAFRPGMHAYLATICRDLGGEPLRVGGVADHVHVVTTLPRTLSQAQLVEGIKKPSSKWIKAFDPCYRGFFWQRGYGPFQSARASSTLCCNTWRRRKSTIALGLFKRNTVSCYADTALSSTSDMCGIESEPGALSRAFSARSRCG